MRKTKSQSAMEFIALASFMLFVLLGFSAVTSSRILEAKEEGNRKVAEDIANFAYREIEIAKSVNDGYKRSFELPQKVLGNDYTIKIVDNRELVVTYIDKEHVLFLPEKVCGDIFIPNNEIDKDKGVICANSNLDFTQCKNAQDLNLCDSIEGGIGGSGPLPGAKCCCCSRYSFCC